MPKDLWEDEARDRFVTFLREKWGREYRTIAEDVPVTGGKNFDYLLECTRPVNSRLALELFRLTPGPLEIARTRVWSQIIADLRTELLANGVTGYLIHTPHFQVTRPKRRQFVRELAERIARVVRAQPDADEMVVGEYTIARIPGLGGVEFIGGVSGGAFSAKAIAYDSLSELFGWKNGQLNTAGCIRDVLIVNWNPLVDFDSVLLACSRLNFETFPNIDEVYFEASPSDFRTVFDRSVHDRIGRAEVTMEDLQNAYAVWLIEARLVDHDIHALNVVKKLTAEEGSLDWLSSDAHSNLIMVAQDLTKTDKIEDGLWIIRNLRHSTEPGTRASICWALHSLILKDKPEVHAEILDILEQYAKGKNANVRANLPMPLAELVARSKRKNHDGTPFMSAECVSRARGLAFELLQGAAGELADRLSWVFFYIRDVNETEARDIIETLVTGVHRHLSQISTLIIYFAIYRERQYPELGHFDGTWFKNLLREMLKNGRTDLRRTLVWSIWRGLSHDIGIDDVAPYLVAIPDGTFEGSTFGHLYRIIRDHLAPQRPSLCPLFLAALRREKEYLSIPENQVWHFEEFFETVRKSVGICQPEAVAEIRKTLFDFSKKLGVSDEFLNKLFTM